jgi:hypothetical protein
MFIVRTAATPRPPKEVHVYSQDRRDPPTSEGGPCFMEIRIRSITRTPWEGLSTFRKFKKIPRLISYVEFLQH